MSYRHFVTLSLAACISAALLGGCGDDDNTPATYTVIETIAGTGVYGIGPDSLSAVQSMLNFPRDVAFGPDGNPYIADFNNHRITMVKQGVMYVVCGNGSPGDPIAGPPRDIQLSLPSGVTFAPDGKLIIFAWGNSKILSLDFANDLVTPIAGTSTSGFGGDGGPAIAATLDHPLAGFFDDDGRLDFMDQGNFCIRRIEAGNISTFAGVPTQPGFVDSVPSAQAKFDLPTASPAGRIAIVEESAVIYVADTNNGRIRIMEPEGPVPSVLSPAHEEYDVRTFAGNGTQGFGGDGGPALEASFDHPSDVDIDSDGNVYVADTNNHCIRKIDRHGIVSTFAGRPGFANQDSINVGDGGSPRDAYLASPSGICFDAEGNLYIADTGHQRIRVIWKHPEAHQ